MNLTDIKTFLLLICIISVFAAIIFGQSKFTSIAVITGLLLFIIILAEIRDVK